MGQLSRLFWTLLPAVRRGERPRFLFFWALNVLLSASQTIGLAGSEALFLGHLGAEALPVAFILASLSTVAASLIYASAVGRIRNDALLVALLSVIALILAALTPFLFDAVPNFIIAAFCAFYVGQAIFINLHFFTFAADFFDTLSSKRLFPLFAVGSSIGGIIGGGMALGLSSIAPAPVLILGWAIGLATAAGFTRLAATQLRRWTPVGLVEADESSTEGMLNAVRFARKSPLAVGLVVSIIGMIFALFLLQFLYMKIFAETFESPEALASFFGIYLALSNGVELVVGHSITPWFIRRLGVGRANLVHPLLTLGSLAFLFIDPRVYAAVVARGTRELLNDSMASPIRTLTFNALPYRFRGRVRALVEGIVSFAAMSIAGGALVLVGTDVDSRWLLLAGFSAACLYLLANLRVRRNYIESLISQLQSGQLRLDDYSGDLGASDVATLAAQWEAILDTEPEHPSSALLELAPLLARHQVTAPVERAVSHAHPLVRAACIHALTVRPPPAFEEQLARALDDPSPLVRLAAAEAAEAYAKPSPELQRALLARLGDEDCEIRAEAARRLGEEGMNPIARMARSNDSTEATAALDRLPENLLECAIEQVRSDHPQIRAAALDSVTRLADPHPIAIEDLVADLHHGSPAVRAAAARALQAVGDSSTTDLLAHALDDAARDVRESAANALASFGEVGMRAAAEGPLGSLRIWTAEAAIRSLESSNSSLADAVLDAAYTDRVDAACRALAAQQRVPSEDDSLPMRFLRAALVSAQSRHCWVAFRLLQAREDPTVVRSIQKSLNAGFSRQHSDALELLSNLADRAASGRLALVLEGGPAEDAISTLSSSIELPASFDEVLASTRQSDNRWLRLAARGCLAVREGAAIEEEAAMESLLALQSVSLFSGLSFEQLEAVKQAMKQVEYVTGETVVREGDFGEDLFVLLEGEVRAYKSYDTPEQLYLSTMSPVSYFGEIAILDSSPRTATVVVTKNARLLSLAGDRFKELVLQSPEISFEIFRVLTARVRAAEAR